MVDLLQKGAPLFEFHVLRPFIIVFVQPVPTYIHPVVDDLDRHVPREMMGDAPASDRVWTNRFWALAYGRTRTIRTGIVAEAWGSCTVHHIAQGRTMHPALRCGE